MGFIRAVFLSPLERDTASSSPSHESHMHCYTASEVYPRRVSLFSHTAPSDWSQSTPLPHFHTSTLPRNIYEYMGHYFVALPLTQLQLCLGAVKWSSILAMSTRTAGWFPQYSWHEAGLPWKCHVCLISWTHMLMCQFHASHTGSDTREEEKTLFIFFF